MEDLLQFEEKNTNKKQNRQCMQSFYSHKRHYFIMTRSGKPIFTKFQLLIRYGDQIELSTFFANLSVIIEKYSQFNSSSSYKTELDTLIFPNYTIYMWPNQNLLFMCISKIQNESEYLIRSTLKYLDLFIISILTNQIQKRLENRYQINLRQNADPSNLINGMDKQIINSIKTGTNTFYNFQNAYPCLPLNKHLREKISEILRKNFINEYLQIFQHRYQILLTTDNIIQFTKSKNIEGNPMDFIIILNWMRCQQQLRSEQNWIPICIPSISQDGYVYAYVHFLSDKIGIIIITDDPSEEIFHSCTQISQEIKNQLSNFGLVNQIHQFHDSLPIKLDSFKIQYLNHLVIKNLDNNQILITNQKQKLLFKEKQQLFNLRLIREYADLYQQYLNYNQINKEFITHQMLEVNQLFKDYINCLYSNSEYILIFSLPIFIKLESLNIIIQKILRFLKSDENIYFFQ